MSLNVVAVITAKPGSESVVQEALTALVTPTRQEEGCESYELNRSAADPTVFVTVEQWRQQSDLDAHLQTPHLQKALSDAEGHLAQAPAIHPLEAPGT